MKIFIVLFHLTYKRHTISSAPKLTIFFKNFLCLFSQNFFYFRAQILLQKSSLIHKNFQVNFCIVECSFSLQFLIQQKLNLIYILHWTSHHLHSKLSISSKNISSFSNFRQIFSCQIHQLRIPKVTQKHFKILLKRLHIIFIFYTIINLNFFIKFLHAIFVFFRNFMIKFFTQSTRFRTLYSIQ